jgi:diaminopimelate decarboxylase
VAIAGLGPKGLFALERLLDHTCGLDAAMRMEIDLYEPHPVPGAGPNYDPSQPAYLRMNFAADQLDLWWPSSEAVPASERQPFIAWSAHSGVRHQVFVPDPDVCTPTDEYPARAEVGRYLADGFETLLRHVPPNADVRVRPAAVDAIEADGPRWAVRAGDASSSYDEVLIAVGHQDAPDAGPSAGWAHAAPLVAAVFPVGRRLSRAAVPPGATVAIRGFALTFIDAALALTEGRGGSFEPLDHPFRLRYVPGDDDAGAIVPFTRSGRAMLAKPGPQVAARVPALGRIAAEGRARIADLGGTVDLHGELMPILTATACANLVAANGDTGEWSIRVAVGRRLAEAVGGVTAADEPDPADAIERSLAVGAGLAPPGVPWALGHTWRSLYPALVARLGGDGLAAHDWPAFLRLSAEMERIAFGPPPMNAAKLLALVEAGRVDLSHVRGGTLGTREGRTAVRSERGERALDVVIDAVLSPPGALGRCGLLADLVAAGSARIAPCRRGLEVTADASCRAGDGKIATGLAALGRPTEDSVIGNDTLSRLVHPQADRWARRVAQRCREDYLATRRRGLRGGGRT